MPSHHDYGIDNETFCGGTPDDEDIRAHSPCSTSEEPMQFNQVNQNQGDVNNITVQPQRRSDVWTYVAPKEDGYYWHRTGIEHFAVVRYVRDGAVFFGSTVIPRAETLGGQWFGPLKEPGGDAIENCPTPTS
jgi:hypothetical protein